MADDLFAKAKSASEPLAARMRPRNLDEYIGQDHIVGKGRLLRRAIAADQLTSVIFYGPPGSGKTTLARVIANHTKSNFITLNAVLTGVADIRNAIKDAEEHYNLYSRRTILFVDEVHRWNKSQQDALLPWVENGTIILIGATTENPFFEVNKALVSRSRVFQLKALSESDLRKAAEQTINDVERGYGHWRIVFEDGALEHLIETANGDARSLLNALELAVETTPEKWNPKAEPPVPSWGSEIYISRETAEESIQKKVVLYDKDGDYHYDIISAFIKSLRGRDPDAAMYWMARMVRAGEDPHFIFRRMMISACEDTGLADPMAISVVESCAAAFDRVGLPEGRYFLAHAALYLATAPKSNSSMAFFDALSAVEKEDFEVPNHLRDNNRDAEGFGHGAGYLYPHAYRDHWVAQQYLPGELTGRVFYTPTTQGYEGKIRSEVLSRREIQIASILEDERQKIEEKILSEREAKRTIDNGAKKNSDEGDGGIPNGKFSGGFGENIDSASLSGEGGRGSEENEISQFDLQTISDWWIKEHFKNGTKKKGENLTFSPENRAKETALNRADRFWQQRLDSNRAEVLLSIRDSIIESAELLRHYRSLIWNADSGLLVWEIARRTPEGVTCGVCKTEQGKNILEQYGRTLQDLDRPILFSRPPSKNNDFLSTKDFRDIILKFQYKGTIFDRLFFVDPFSTKQSIDALVDALKAVAFYEDDSNKIVFTDSNAGEIENPIEFADDEKSVDGDFSERYESPLADGWRMIISQKIPVNGQRISRLIRSQILSDDTISAFDSILRKMEDAENEFFGDKSSPLFAWDSDYIKSAFENAGFTVWKTVSEITEKRRITLHDIKIWFDAENSRYGNKMLQRVGVSDLQKIVRLLESSVGNKIYNWKTEVCLMNIGSPKNKWV